MDGLPESILQLGFAAAACTYLIYYMTTQIRSSIDANTNAMIGLQLIQAELYKLLLQHDATMRGISPETAATADTEAHRQAIALYTQVITRVDQLQARIAELKVNHGK